MKPELIEGRAYEGEYALSFLPPDYSGICALRAYNRNSGFWVKIASREAAETAASGACRWDVGGYSNVSLHVADEAPIDTPLYESVLDWLFTDVLDEDNVERVPTETPAFLRWTSRRIARLIAQQPASIFDVDWRQLETALGAAFEALGFRTTVTRPARDGGYDLLLDSGSDTYLLEVKHWRTRVGKRPVKRFAEIAAERQLKGMLLSTSGFTKSALRSRVEVSSTPIAFGDKTKIVTICQYYFLNEKGLWFPQSNLRDVFFDRSF